MNKLIAAASTLSAVTALVAFAQRPQGKKPAPPMSFFVTSVGMGKGGDLGGLAGADRHCQMLAAAVGAGDRTWHAYLSTEAKNGQPAVNARDRIGQGPWWAPKGYKIADNLAQLHGDTLELAQIGNNLTHTSALNEKGELVNSVDNTPNEHDILTGSKADGRAFTDDKDHTCNNWTSSGEGSAMLGHADRDGLFTSWNSAHGSRGCSQEGLKSTGGAGLFYCFSVDAAKN